VPRPRSRLLRYIIETLLITHAETELNMICPMGGNPEHRYGRGYDLEWCRFIHPPASVSSNATTTTDPSLPNMMTTL
jgi:hypothetical protein